MAAASTILGILNLVIPEVTNLVVMIRNATGGASAIVYLDQADASFATNLAQIDTWMKSHGATATTVATPPAA